MTGRGRGRGRGRRGSVTSQPSQPPIPSLHIQSSQTGHTLTPSPHSQNQTRPTPAAPSSTAQSHSHSQTRPTPINIPQPSQAAPMPTPSPHSQSHIGASVQNAPMSSPSPHSHSGASIDAPHDPSLSSHANPQTETSSLIPENIKWGSRDADGRKWIKPAPGNNFHPEWKVRGVITKNFKEKFEGAWTTWSSVDDDTKNTWFREFKAIFKWLEQDEDNIKKSFNSRGALALKNALFKVRSGEDKGDWIDEQNLAQMKVVWQEADWQQISTINKQNRQSQHGLNVHSGGSISAREHAKRLKVELNREPTHFELFKRLHRPKGKPDEWFSEKQAKIVEMYETQLSERQSHSGEGSSQQSTQQSDNNIYLEVVEVSTRRDVYWD